MLCHRRSEEEEEVAVKAAEEKYQRGGRHGVRANHRKRHLVANIAGEHQRTRMVAASRIGM